MEFLIKGVSTELWTGLREFTRNVKYPELTEMETINTSNFAAVRGEMEPWESFNYGKRLKELLPYLEEHCHCQTTDQPGANQENEKNETCSPPSLWSPVNHYH